ncbi:hypothetical protein EV360DRAFT_80694 [Lentinula raphanica]|nr:hypothetical protein EV360DRAFT_80694 [Lentinula raphanica]
MEPEKRSLSLWRDAGESSPTARVELWSPYRQFFQIHGYYTLWNVSRDFAHVPPNDNPRAPNGFSYENEYSANARRICYTASPIHFPAHTMDNGDVMIALLSDGVVDSNCLKVLRSIATGKNAGIAELNRLRDELPTEILRASIKQPDYYDLTDEFDADYASPS